MNSTENFASYNYFESACTLLARKEHASGISAPHPNPEAWVRIDEPNLSQLFPSLTSSQNLFQITAAWGPGPLKNNPGYQSLSKHVQKILGNNGVNRFEKFKKLAPGWDHGRGEALSSLSIMAMEKFLKNFSGFPGEPSVFITTNGNLQIAWEDQEGRDFELEFFPDKIEYFLGSLEEEGEIALEEKSISKLISKFS